MTDNSDVLVIGGGFAGVEAAWALAEAGLRVSLAEMRPVKMTPAHKTGNLAELVCSNSFKSDAPASASHLLKEEMRRLGSLTMRTAEASKVPAGAALAVDRDVFSNSVTDAICSHPNITLVREEVTSLPDDIPAIVATGPLTSDALSSAISEITGTDYLYFHDAIAPVIDADSINRDRVYHASRYDKGEGGYLNCAMDREQYYAFLDALLSAERIQGHDFENMHLFEGCMPIEEMAARGRETLTFGPLKPIGLNDPKTGQRPYAVAQLRQDNLAASLYGLVGFQTRLKYGEQQRVFRMLPGLENAEFVQYGSMHRNTYINAPRVLDATLRVRDSGSGIRDSESGVHRSTPLYFAGQIVGVEGYVESAATGIIAGRALAAELRGEEFKPLPPETILGALCHYVANSEPDNFQPMNACFGILPPIGLKAKKLVRHAAMVERGIAAIERYLRSNSSQ